MYDNQDQTLIHHHSNYGWMGILWGVVVFIVYGIVTSILTVLIVLPDILSLAQEMSGDSEGLADTIESLIFANPSLVIMANAIGQILAMGGITYLIANYYRKVLGQSLTEFVALKRQMGMWIYFLWILIILVLLLPVFQHVQTFIYYLLPDDFIEIAKKQSQQLIHLVRNSDSLLPIVFGVAIVPAICEEFLFRGVLLKLFRVQWGKMHAVWISSFIFSIFHFQFINIIPLFCIGALFAILTIKSGSIIPAIVLHFLNNMFAIISARVLPEDLIENDDPQISIYIALLTGVVALYLIYRMVKVKGHAEYVQEE